MYPYGYRRRGFHFGWVPFVLGFVFLAMLFSGGFRHVWFFAWPLFCVLPFVFAAGVFMLFGRHWRERGYYRRKYGEFLSEEKPKRGGDSDSEIYYV